jgi:hypothetical protein
MKKAQAQKLELLQRLAALEDPKKIKQLMAFWDFEINEPVFPPDEVLLKMAEEGRKQIEAGNFVTMEELEVRLEEAIKQGLKQRIKNGLRV